MTDFDFVMGLRDFDYDPIPQYKSKLPLIGIDGNAFSVMAQVSKGLRRAGAPKEYIDDVMKQMQSGDYDNLLAVAIRYTEDA